MKSKRDFDPDWQAPLRHRLWPFRSIRDLMVVVAVSGLLFGAAVTAARQTLPQMFRRDLGLSTVSTAPPRGTLAPARVRAPMALVAQVQPRDPMVVFAPESIDPGMVVRASDWIDPQMVFTRRAVTGSRNRRRWHRKGWCRPRGWHRRSPPGIAPRVWPQSKLIPIPDRLPPSPRAREPRFKRLPNLKGSPPSAKKPPS